ncbi:hypothetical protein [Embleya scabrispora]|uniref:hypothetical protein n=1 Tax=Embleya scabrispora TaxID=159449 RepID=UPI00037C577F|nr:hypothetical protein [Embleya scabrispora]MYS79354.1 hypothetical protein [Streptomyces sp. SID5474]
MSAQSLHSTFATGGPGDRAVRGDTGLLRIALRLDAIATGAVGLAALAGCAAFDGALGLPTAFLAGLGAFLVLYALGVWRVAGRSTPHRTAVRVVIGLNLLWFADSVLTAVAGWLDPTGLGTTLIVLQAIAVLAFADVQVFALRKANKSVR